MEGDSSGASEIYPHRQCILDLQAWVELQVSNNFQIILALDSNEEITQKQGQFRHLPYTGNPIKDKQHNSSLATLVMTCGLVDPLAYQHSMRRFPATYNRGKSRLDYILVSAQLLPAVQRSGILPFQSIFISDHRPCFIDLCAQQIFGNKTQDIAPQCQWQLQLRDLRVVEAYNGALEKQ